MSNQVVRNLTSENCIIKDIGHVIKGDSTSILTDEFEITDICNSNNLKTLISNNTLLINDGTNNLSISDAIDFLTLEQKYCTKYNTPSIKIIDGVLYYADTARGKQLSNPTTIKFSKYGTVSNDFLYCGYVPSTYGSYILGYDAVLIGYSYNNYINTVNTFINIQKNSDTTSIIIFNVLNEYSKIDFSLNININSTDYFKVLCTLSPLGGIPPTHPLLTLYFSRYGGDL